MALNKPKNFNLAILMVITGLIGVNAICKPGWMEHGSSCYNFTDQEMTWQNGSSYCQELDGMLLVIETEEENDFIAEILRNLNISWAWLGCGDKVTEGTWVCYPEGVKRMQYENWGEGRPSNYKNQDCATIDIQTHDGQWNDRWCSSSRYTVCKTTSSRVPAMSCFSLGFDGHLHL